MEGAVAEPGAAGTSAIRARFPRGLRGTIMSADAEFAQAVVRACGRNPDVQINIPVAMPHLLPEVITQNSIDVVLIDSELTGRESGLTVAERTAKTFPRIYVYLVSSNADLSLHRVARSHGLAGVLPRSFTPEALVKVVSDAVTMEDPFEEQFGRNGSAPEIPGRQSAPVVVSKVFAVANGKGGTGKSQVSVNFAMLCQLNAMMRTPAAYLDLERGDGAGIYLIGGNVNRKTDVSNWAAYVSEEGLRLDPNVVLQHLLVEHDKTGLHVVPSTATREEYDLLSEETVELALSTLRSMHAVTVADCPPSLTVPALCALRDADTILIVTDLDPHSVAQTNTYLKDLRGTGEVDISKAWVVYNRVRPGSPVRPEDANEVLRPLGVTISPVLLPEDPQVTFSRNNMQPTVLQFPDCPWSKAMRSLAANVLPGIGLEMGARGRTRPAAAAGKRRRFLGVF